ncbi:hypothetical protein SODALDRAFT_356359 [Sodiomyces alkalinus F11]|uniref:Uncharacterized protein n=1 Tax=Sodiomyces alkalinus (strain CBS 110278 / VKM F-3762 / F11) TaxID=1314773 RepID=A0A3N2Q0U4_SODAK|nr:hypothetical protein SODALDRAFT_356359 [Sodiomyces alkalinus F11]ROT40379.1 hypothetical protein SODALDRAFT_356359 [Sodiomyces alkalinus F11]
MSFLLSGHTVENCPLSSHSGAHTYFGPPAPPFFLPFSFSSLLPFPPLFASIDTLQLERAGWIRGRPPSAPLHFDSRLFMRVIQFALPRRFRQAARVRCATEPAINLRKSKLLQMNPTPTSPSTNHGRPRCLVPMHPVKVWQWPRLMTWKGGAAIPEPASRPVLGPGNTAGRCPTPLYTFDD